MWKNRRPIWLLTGSLSLWVYQTAALAQAETGGSLEEILVTAQRKAQSVQDVPISIAVVSADDITRNSIFDFTETAQLTPGVTLNTTTAALASISVRGVGPGFFAPTAQSVPIFVDEVPAAQPGAVFNTMVDVERVELLRGPQGTLYGRNAPSGAYNITTVSPGFEGVEGFINGSWSRWDANGEPAVDVRGAVNLPLTDRFAARLAGVYAETEGGIAMDSPFAREDALGGKDHRSVRLRLLFEPGPDSRLDLITNYQELEDNYSIQMYDGLVPGTGGTNPVAAIFNKFSDRRDYSERRSQSTTDVKDVALKYAWACDLTNIDFILAYQDFETSLFQNQNPFPTLDPGFTDLNLETQQTTLELRASDSGDVFDYVAGVFLSDADSDAITILDVPGAFVPSLVTQETTGAAVFGNFTFHLAEKWDFSAGLRYEDNTQDYKSTADVVGFTGDLDETLDFDHLSWSLKLSFFANDQTTAYLAIDNAYRQGGLNSYSPALGAVGIALSNPAIIETAEDFLFWDEEVSTSFEVGVKGTLLDNKMRYSLAVFYQEFEDHIIRQNAPSFDELQIVGPLYGLFFVNAEEVVTQGFEFDLIYQLSQRWTVDFRSAYFDATVGEWQDRLCELGVDPTDVGPFCPAESGSELSSLPKWNTNTQLSYFSPLDNGWTLFGTLSWTWRSKAAENSEVTNRYNDPENFVGLNVGMANDRFSVTLWGKNLTDQQELQVPTETANGDPALPPALTSGHNSGRQYGLTLGYTF
ncbi:MAG: TonB-dependent receptor [Pseudomonadota bacterium]